MEVSEEKVSGTIPESEFNVYSIPFRACTAS